MDGGVVRALCILILHAHLHSDFYAQFPHYDVLKSISHKDTHHPHLRKLRGVRSIRTASVHNPVGIATKHGFPLYLHGSTAAAAAMQTL